MTTSEYLASIHQRYELGNATEHTFRGDLQQLIESLVPTIRATNEPKRQKCGAPDYILTKKDIPVGFIEAKDIGDNDLEGKKKTGNKAQSDRYKASLNNIIFTDYLDFYFYKNEVLVSKIKIAKLIDQKIVALPENYLTFESLLKNFVLDVSQTISNSQKLAQMMAGKARLLSDVIEKALIADEESSENSSLRDQMEAFRLLLIHDIKPKSFADVYAQTITYGLFAARLQDADLNTFSRQKAYELIPASNPFLKKLFGYIAGLDVDDRIRWIVDSLVTLFLACDVAKLLKNYGQDTQTEDPIIHFYENFLAEYDPNLRKSRGVWYTPAPVVNFIVRAVDDILKTEFDLSQGLADTSKINIEVKEANKLITKEVHKVQILDPATGTGTFLAEVVKQIYKKFEGQEGIWNSYVENHLLPRLNGFELLMASYAMAHLQLNLLLTETGFKSRKNERLRVFLTNSLEEASTENLNLFMAQWLTIEANEANRIKSETPVMCVIGNPPYAVSSSNKSDWILKLIADYKKGLHEQSYNSLSDDYVKFIRFGQHFIDKNGAGVLAYISNNSFLDGIIHRQMRKHLLDSFDKIYILDLHGNARKKETNIDGSVDQNVFDIMQGVSINIFVKTGKKRAGELGEVYHYDLQGKRKLKYDFLLENSLKSVCWEKLRPAAPYFFFVPTDFSQIDEYEKGFKVTDLFSVFSSGIESHKDSLTIQFDQESLSKIKKNFLEMNFAELQLKYKIAESRDWKMEWAKADLKNTQTMPINYRLFDKRYTEYSGKSGFIAYPRHDVSRNLLKENIALILPRLCKGQNGFEHGFVSKYLVDRAFGDAFSGAGTNVFPLYIYAETEKKQNVFHYSEKDKLVLLAKLAQAKEHHKEIKTYFNKTVLPFYKAVKEPDAEHSKLFEEHRTTYEESRANVEKLQEQIANFEAVPEEMIVSDPISTERKANFNKETIEKFAKNLGLVFTNEKQDSEGTFAAIDVLDYIYAVLYSPAYREKYKEFLKIDFPRVPFPKSYKVFKNLIALGNQLRQIHLLESPEIDNFQTKYAQEGDDVVRKTRFESNKVYINETQYFENVPELAWNFYIGGYQPAQKWLKDRKERKLEFEDILHYQKIIWALTETDRLMKEVDLVL